MVMATVVLNESRHGIQDATFNNSKKGTNGAPDVNEHVIEEFRHIFADALLPHQSLVFVIIQFDAVGQACGHPRSQRWHTNRSPPCHDSLPHR